ncbi:MAG: hypothetical protein K9K38_16685 [Rhodoferax sp.]|nr:hypothetical protein [Rhodoferax sp.]MCF8211016.1 hypothetical protein [Rhodoferax sp.]
MPTTPSDMARPASVADLKLLLSALHTHGVDYLLVGGYALFALGYQRGTVDIDILLRPTLEQGERAKHALLMLPEGVAKDLDPAWFQEGDTIRVADSFVVDLMFNACGETYESLLPYAVEIDFDGVPLRTVTLEGLLKTKQTSREKDQMDRVVLERALEASKTQGLAE